MLRGADGSLCRRRPLHSITAAKAQASGSFRRPSIRGLRATEFGEMIKVADGVHVSVKRSRPWIVAKKSRHGGRGDGRPRRPEARALQATQHKAGAGERMPGPVPAPAVPGPRQTTPALRRNKKEGGEEERGGRGGMGAEGAPHDDASW